MEQSLWNSAVCYLINTPLLLSLRYQYSAAISPSALLVLVLHSKMRKWQIHRKAHGVFYSMGLSDRNTELSHETCIKILTEIQQKARKFYHYGRERRDICVSKVGWNIDKAQNCRAVLHVIKCHQISWQNWNCFHKRVKTVLTKNLWKLLLN